MNRRIAIWLAITIGGLNICLGVTSLVFGKLNGMDAGTIFADPGWMLGLSMSVIGMIIAAYQPRHPIGWIFFGVGFFQGLSSFAINYAQYALITSPGALPGGNLASWLGQVAWFPGLLLLVTFLLLLFPTGHLASRRWRPVAWLSVVVLFLFIPLAIASLPYRGIQLLEDPNQFQPPASSWLGILYNTLFPMLMACGLLSVISLVARYRSAQLAERQQIKWFTYATVITFLTIALSNFLLTPDNQDRSQVLIIHMAESLIVAPAIPLAAGIAILRYKLWDIDFIIRKTLVYSILTGSLGLVYFGLIVLLEGILRAVAGGSNQVATVVSTLVIAALFSPLRRRVQNFIDRRFYRRKYDLEKTLAAFSSTLRDQVDLDQLSEHLVSVVEETIQPVSVFVWLANPKK